MKRIVTIKPISRREWLSYATAAAGMTAISTRPLLSAESPRNDVRIVPPRSWSGHVFVILDPLGRLSRDTLVVFSNPVIDEVEYTELREVNRKGTTGRGRVPLLAGNDVYDVTVRPPGQASFSAGTLLVTAPTIDPENGLPGSTFMIKDPIGRMEAGDVALFYVLDEGADPALGVPASDVQVSRNGKMLIGEVPFVPGDSVYGVAVRPSPTDASRFADLPFFVEELPVVNPTLEPQTGVVGSEVMLIDPQGRIQPGDLCFFQGPDPDTAPVEATGVTVSPDGTAMLFQVPNVPEQQTYEVTVHASLLDAPRFEALLFDVVPMFAEPNIMPTGGGVGVTFIINDNAGRIQQGDQAIFYLPGTQPSDGTPATSVSVVSDGTSLLGHVPNVVTTLIYLVSVRADANSPARFDDLVFSVL